MNKQEAIKRVEQMGEYERFVDEPVSKKSVLDIISKIQEPQKVTVPKFVAEWIEEGKRSGWHLQKALYRLDDDDKVGDWAYDENDDLVPEKVDMIARAWLAYPNITVEQEKLYTVEIPNPNLNAHTVLQKTEKGIVLISVTNARWRGWENSKLTESEIKQDFEWARQFKKEVDEK